MRTPSLWDRRPCLSVSHPAPRFAEGTTASRTSALSLAGKPISRKANFVNPITSTTNWVVSSFCLLRSRALPSQTHRPGAIPMRPALPKERQPPATPPSQPDPRSESANPRRKQSQSVSKTNFVNPIGSTKIGFVPSFCLLDTRGPPVQSPPPAPLPGAALSSETEEWPSPAVRPLGGSKPNFAQSHFVNPIESTKIGFVPSFSPTPDPSHPPPPPPRPTSRCPKPRRQSRKPATQRPYPPVPSPNSPASPASTPSPSRYTMTNGANPGSSFRAYRPLDRPNACLTREGFHYDDDSS